jgi:hypothetical protein
LVEPVMRGLVPRIIFLCDVRTFRRNITGLIAECRCAPWRR